VWHELDGRVPALCLYAVKLTRTPAWVTEGDVAALRAAGLDDRAIVDANQVVSYFNYVNRIADGLGVELEQAWPEPLRQTRGYRAVVRADDVPWLTVDEMREIDRIAVDELGISLQRMMENAGRALATLAATLLGATTRRRVAVLAGPGGNGGGGMVAARHLAAAGADVVVHASAPEEDLAPVTAEQYAILRAIDLPLVTGADIGTPDLVIDALLGYSQRGAPRGEVARLVTASRDFSVLSLDVPSGLDLASASAYEPHVEAQATLTLAAPKRGLRHAPAAGDLYLADIGVPDTAYARGGIRYSSPFSGAPIIRLR
jgi:NAD(P)H-hydrate epimerase